MMSKAKSSGAAPDVFDFGIAQLGIDGDHAAPENFRAAANGAAGFGKERGTAAKEHAAVGREAVVVQIIFGIEDHAMRGLSSAASFSGRTSVTMM